MLVSTIIFIIVLLILGIQPLKSRLEIACLILYVFSAIRFDFGNDFMPYYYNFLEIGMYANLFQLCSAEYYQLENGYIAMNWLWSHYGGSFHSLIAVLSALHVFVIYLMFKRLVPSRYYVLAMFVYLFLPELFLVQLSAMRQTVAVDIEMIVILILLNPKLSFKWKYPLSFLLILVAAQFHQSAYFLFGIPLLNFPWCKTKMFLRIFCITLFLVCLSGNAIITLGLSQLAYIFPKYEVYVQNDVVGTSVNSGLGFFFNIVVLILLVVCYSKADSEEKLILNINLLGYFAMPLGLMLASLGRLLIYSYALTPFIISPMLKNFDRFPSMKVVFMSAYSINALYNYYLFFNSSVYGPYFSVYKTIFSL